MAKTYQLNEIMKDNFWTMQKAFKNDDVALLLARNKTTGEFDHLLCIVTITEKGEYDVMPVAKMLNNPGVEDYENPAEDDFLIRRSDGTIPPTS